MNLELEGKVAFVAGGSQGLGFGIARELIREGAQCLLGSRSEEPLINAGRQLDEEFGLTRVSCRRLDTSQSDSIEEWISEGALRFGRLDMLVVNTGGPAPGGFEELSEEQWVSAFQQILLGAVRMVRQALPLMERSGGGSILFITSTSVRQPIENLLLSNVYRPALAALAKSLSLEFAEKGIRVNTLMPGRIDTERVRSLDRANSQRKQITPEEIRALAESGIPLGRYGTTEEFGRMASFLLSPAASFVTGTTIAVDGGMLKTI